MIKQKNDSFLTITYLLIVLLPIYDCIMYLLSAIHINLPLRMLHLYLLVMVYMICILIKFGLPLYNSFAAIGILSFYGISYLWTTEQARVYFDNTDLTAVLIVFIPVTCLCTSRIKDWNKLFNNKYYCLITDIIIVISLLSKLSLYNDSDYMSFSYRLLPLWGLCFISAYYCGHKSQWIFLAVGLFEGLIFGARAPLFFIILLAFLSWVILSGDDFRNRNYRHLLPVLIMFFVAIVFIAFILPAIMQSSLFNDSYILRRLQGSSLLESTGREHIYAICRKEIANMGLEVHGLFYDRTVLPNGMYAHNIVYEILLSFGWLLGIPLILFIVCFTIFTFIKQNVEGKIYVSFAVCSFFLRYLFSGSIFDETEFMIFIAILYSLQVKNSNTLKTTNQANKDNRIGVFKIG